MEIPAAWLVHENNIDGKIFSNYANRSDDFSRFRTEIYLPYKYQQMRITGITENDMNNKARLLDDYLRNLDIFNDGGWVRAQSKFKSTVLEEFCGYIFKDLPTINDLGLNFCMRRVFAGIRIEQNGEPYFETKDVDFCLTKSVEAVLAGVPYHMEIPIIAIECKTYVDKTMFNEAQFTAQKLKGGAPRVKVYMITEANAISPREIPSQTPIDQIYVLRSQSSPQIDGHTVWELFCDIRNELNKIGAQQNVQLPGKLIIK